MSNMTIEVINTTVNTVTKGNKSYNVADVAYKNLSFDGKVEGKKIVDFADKQAFEVLKNAKQGDKFDITRVKNDAGFWSWANVVSVEGINIPTTATNLTSGATKVPRNTYETPEERAARQVLIVRQSSISAAVTFVTETAKTADKTIQNVIDTAKAFEAYVFGNDTDLVSKPEDPFEDLKDDIPF